MCNITSKWNCQHTLTAEDKSVSKAFTERKDLWRNWQVPIFLTDCWNHTYNITLGNLWFLRDFVGLSVLCIYGLWLPVCVRKDRSQQSEALWHWDPFPKVIPPVWWPQWDVFGSLFLSGLLWLQRLLLYFCHSLLQINLSQLGDSWRKCQLLLKWPVVALDGYGAHIHWSLKQKRERKNRTEKPCNTLVRNWNRMRETDAWWHSSCLNLTICWLFWHIR